MQEATAKRAGDFDSPKTNTLPETVSEETIKNIALVPVNSESGNITHVGYDGATETAVVVYKGDRKYLYHQVGSQVGLALLASAADPDVSTGKLVVASFKKLPFQRIEPASPKYDINKAERNDTLTPNDSAQAKEGSTTTPFETTVIAADVPLELPEYPVDLINKFTEQRITKKEAQEALRAVAEGISVHDLKERSRAIVVTSEDQTDLMKQARTLRLAIRSDRVEIEHKRKEVKEPHLRRIQVIDGTARILKDFLETEESYLKTQEEFALRAEAARKDVIETERVNLIAPFVESCQFFNLRDMSQEAFDQLLSSSKIAYEQKQKEIADQEAARLAAEEADKQALARLNKVLNRERQLSSIGMQGRGEQKGYVYENLTVTQDQIEDMDDAEWLALVSEIAESIQVDELEKAEAAEAQFAENEQLNNEKAARLFEEQKKREEVQRLAAAGDRTQFGAYLDNLRDAEKAFRPQELKTVDGKTLADRFFDDFSNLINDYAKRAAELKDSEFVCPF